MPRLFAWMVVAAIACAAPRVAAATECDGMQAGQARADQGAGRGAKPDDGRPPDPRYMWWKTPETRAELKISDQQSKDIDDIFQKTRPQLKTAKDELDRLNDMVSQMIKDGSADPDSVKTRVAELEQARARLNQARTMMLYRMHRVLSPDQRAKLNAKFERWEAEHGRQNPAKEQR